MVSTHSSSLFWVGGVPNNLAVDSAGDAVLQLQVHLGDGVVGEDGGVRDITCRVGKKRTSQSGVVFQGCVEFRSLVRRAVCIGSFSLLLHVVFRSS